MYNASTPHRRESNVTPIHPKLHPARATGSGGGGGATGGVGSASPPPAKLYPHNTYHGPTIHHRAALPLHPSEMKPMRFTDSPQKKATAAGGGGGGTKAHAKRHR